MDRSVLYISYNGLLEPILSSQVIPYLKALSPSGLRFILLTFEKPKDLKNAGHKRIEQIKAELRGHKIHWVNLVYHKRPNKISTFFDLFIGFWVSFFLIFINRISIIHVRGVTPGAIALFLSNIFTKVKLIFDMRGLLAEEYVGGKVWAERSTFFNLVKFIESRLIKNADAIVVLTQKHYEMNLGLPYFKRNTPMAVIPCCVDLNRFKDEVINRKTLLKRYGIDVDNEILFMYSGKLGTYYLVKEMFDFFNCASNFMPQSKFIILTPDSHGIVKEMNISFSKDRVYFLHPSFEEIPMLLRSCDAGLFFINSYKKFGSSPIKLGEFLAIGKPVIINSGIGDTEELVLNNRVGVVIKNFNDEEYSEKINELFSLLRDREGLAKRCRDTVRKFLSLDNGVQIYKDIYMKI